MREGVRALKAVFRRKCTIFSSGWTCGARGLVGSEHCLSREIRKHTVPCLVRAGAVDKFLNLGFVDRRRLGNGCIR